MRMAALHPYPGSDTEESRRVRVEAGAAFEADHLDLVFQITGIGQNGLPEEFSNLPEFRGARKSELWKEICFEAFLPVHHSENYFEFNGAMNGDWDLYQFDSYRSGMRQLACESKNSPSMTSREQSGPVFRVGFRIPRALFSDAVTFAPIGLTLVLKTSNGTTYWALTHAGAKPDFHLRASFIYDPIRN